MSALPRARLSDYREQSGAIRFRISSTTNLHDTVEELKRRVPSWARRYDARTREWSVNADYRTVLEVLFVNTPAVVEPAPRRSARAARRDPFGTEARYTSRARMLWFLIALGGIVVSGALLWSRTPRPNLVPTRQNAVAAEAGAVRVAPPPVTPQAGRVNSVANLRASPGTDSLVLRRAAAGESVTATGKYRADDMYWWLLLQGGAWVRSDLVVRAEPGELPLNLSLLPEVDASGARVADGLSSSAPASGAPRATTGAVLIVVDGNTIHVNLDGREVRVRYIGVTSPERDEYGYTAATDANRALVEGRNVRLAGDALETDDYGRLLRYVYVDHDDDPATAELFVNRALLEQGWAELHESTPNTAYAVELNAALVQAQRAGAGIWR